MRGERCGTPRAPKVGISVLARNEKTKVLTKDEILALRKVKTSEAYAKRILKRNVALLRLFRKGKTGTVRIECPHCVSDCEFCAWQVINPYLVESRQYISNVYACVKYAKFGGVKMVTICRYLEYGDDRAKITAIPKEEAIKLKVETYLLGHIQWALSILAQKG